MPWDLLFGGITGLLGTIMTSITQYKMKKLENEHEVAMMDKQMEYVKVEADASIKITQTKVEGELQLADAKSYETSQTVGNRSVFSADYVKVCMEQTGWASFVTKPFGVLIIFLLGICEFSQTFMRPALTAYLMGASSYITFLSYGIITKVNTNLILTTTEALSIWRDVISCILYLTVSCVTWWFGDRTTAKFLQGMKFGRK